MSPFQQSLARLNEFHSDIARLYARKTTDYRGRTIDEGSVRKYLDAEKYRFAAIASLLPPPPSSSSRLLDVGIAYGFLPALLNTSSSWKCEGLEVAENIPVYCALAVDRSIPIHTGKLGLNPLPFPDESFDAIILSEVLEHLRLSPSLVFLELKRILKKGGYLVITTPNVARLTNILKLLVGRNPLEAFPDDVITDNITEHLTHIREYTMRELIKLCARHKLEILNAHYSRCMEHGRPHFWITACVPPWRGNLMILARK
jgi:SAM-dependent methyltransferase